MNVAATAAAADAPPPCPTPVRRASDHRRHGHQALAPAPRASSSSTPTRPTVPTASPSGRTRSRPTSRSSSASWPPRAAARRPCGSTWGRACGPQYVDLQVVHLSGPRSRYIDDFRAVVGEVTARLGGSDGPRNVTVLADTLNGGTYDYGLGERDGPGRRAPRTRQRPQPRRLRRRAVHARRNARARRRRARVVAGRVPARDDAQPRRGPVVGAAHDPAGRFPAPSYGHCWQGLRRQRAVEDGGAAHPMRYDRPRTEGAPSRRSTTAAATTTSTRPRTGQLPRGPGISTTAAFLAPCSQIAPACGGGLEGTAPTPPVSTGAPRVAGTPRRGAHLAAKPGAWRNGAAHVLLPLAALRPERLEDDRRCPARALYAQARRPWAPPRACR